MQAGGWQAQGARQKLVRGKPPALARARQATAARHRQLPRIKVLLIKPKPAIRPILGLCLARPCCRRGTGSLPLLLILAFRILLLQRLCCLQDCAIQLLQSISQLLQDLQQQQTAAAAVAAG